MHEEECKQLLQKSLLVPPMDIFENPGTKEEVVERLIRRWIELASKQGSKIEQAFKILLELLTSIRPPEEGLIFFGSVIYAPEGEQVSDVDVMRVIDQNGPNNYSFPKNGFIHVLETYRPINYLMFLRLGLANSLLVCPGDDGLYGLQILVQKARKDPEAILDELATSALGKMMAKKEVDIGHLVASDPIHIIAFARDLEEQKLREMTGQTLRRMRVKEREIPRVINLFIRNVKGAG